MTLDTELDHFKKTIDIAELAITYGFIPNPKKSSQSVKSLKDPQSGETYNFRKDPKTHNYLFINTQNEDQRGDVIHFVQKVLHPEYNLGHTRKFLRSFTGEIKTKSAIQQTNKKENAPDFEIKPLQSTAYFQSRGIRPETLNSNPFKSTYGSYTIKGIENVAFPVKTIKGDIVGVELKNKVDGYSFKGAVPGSKKGEGLWFSNAPDSVDHIVITESPIDAMAHYQLHRPQDTLYVTTNGQVTETHQGIIKELVHQNPQATVSLAMDKDPAGMRYNTNLLSAINQARNPASNISWYLKTKGNKELELLIFHQQVVTFSGNTATVNLPAIKTSIDRINDSPKAEQIIVYEKPIRLLEEKKEGPHTTLSYKLRPQIDTLNQLCQILQTTSKVKGVKLDQPTSEDWAAELKAIQNQPKSATTTHSF